MTRTRAAAPGPGILLALLLGLVPALAACSTARQGEPVPRPTDAAVEPSTSLTPPAGVTLTPDGTTLSFGDPAQVAFTQNAERRTVLRLTVTGVRRGRPADLAAYSLDERAQASTPYYVRIAATNLGPGDVSRAAVPLTGLGSDGSTVTPSGFTTPLRQCPSSGPPAALPSVFPAAAATTTCLVYLVPPGTTLSAVAYQPDRGEAITWRGTVTAPGAKGGSTPATLSPSASGSPRATGSPAR